jgi:hypothetical protein
MIYIDTIPLILAIIAIFVSASKYEYAKSKTDQARLLAGIFVSIIMIITQTSFFVTADILSNSDDISFASKLWILFDIIVMLLIIFYPVNKNDSD